MKAKTLYRTTLASAALAAALYATGCAGGESAGGTLAQAQKDGSIYIGDIPFAAPLLYQKNQQMVGPEAELAKKIATLIGAEVGREVAPFWIKRDSYSSLEPDLVADVFDFIISAYGISEERKKAIAFSKPYYKSELMMIINPSVNKDLDPSKLSGRLVAVRTGTVAAERVRAKYPDVQIKEVDTVDNGVLAVRSGEAAAMIDDRYMLAFSLATLTGAQGLEIFDQVIDTVDFAVAVRKSETRVLELVNQAVDEMMGQTYMASIQNELPEADYQAVLKRRPERLRMEQMAQKERTLTVRVSRAAGSDFDIYRFANLSFFLIDSESGKRSTSSKINFQGRVGVCSVRVPPGNYRMVLQKFDFSLGSVVITPTDRDNVSVNITVQADGQFRMTRGD